MLVHRTRNFQVEVTHHFQVVITFNSVNEVVLDVLYKVATVDSSLVVRNVDVLITTLVFKRSNTTRTRTNTLLLTRSCIINISCTIQEHLSLLQEWIHLLEVGVKDVTTSGSTKVARSTVCVVTTTRTSKCFTNIGTFGGPQ